MTAAHIDESAPPAAAVGNPEAAAAAIRAHGLRLSSARRLVLEAIYTAESPVKAEEIAGGLRGRLPRSDLASVYRNLETLERLGLVRHIHLGHGPGRYEPAGGQHDYLVCERCERVATVARESLTAFREAIRRATGFEPRFDHFALSGLCGICQAPDADRNAR